MRVQSIQNKGHSYYYGQLKHIISYYVAEIEGDFLTIIGDAMEFLDIFDNKKLVSKIGIWRYKFGPHMLHKSFDFSFIYYIC